MRRSLKVSDSLVEAATSKRHSTNPIISPPTDKISPPKRVKIAVYMSQDEAARVRGCYAALPASQRPPSLSQWIAGLLRAEMEQIEAKFSTAPVESGKLKKGAPFKE